ncbi:MAG: hypothetical protein ACFE9O_01935 [Promethearchaeota archaeon]
MFRRKTTRLPFRKAWALIFISLLVLVGLYFGFHAISVPALTPVDQARVAIPSQASLSFYSINFEPPDTSDMLSQSLTSWLLHRTADSWFRSILVALAILLIMLIVMALTAAILRQN